MIIDNQHITLRRVTGWDKFKEPTTYADFKIPARVVAETQIVMNPAGKEVVTTYSVQIKRSALAASGAQSVKYNDEIAYRDEDGNLHKREPQTIGGTPGFAGQSFFVRVRL